MKGKEATNYRANVICKGQGEYKFVYKKCIIYTSWMNEREKKKKESRTGGD
jgi:hypothetical protein